MKWSIDSSEVTSPYMAGLIQRYGYEAYGISVCLRHSIASANGRLKRDDDLLAYILRVNKDLVVRVVDAHIESGKLQIEEGVLVDAEIELQMVKSKKKAASMRHSRNFGSVDKKPYPIEESPILLTEAEIITLESRYGTDVLHYVIGEMVSYEQNNPGWLGDKKSHSATIGGWIDRNRKKGLVFFNHPEDGRGWYPRWQMEKVARNGGEV